MNITTWKKGFRRVPDPIRKRLAGLTGDRIVVACVRRIRASALASGRYRHLGLSIDGGGPVFPERVMPDLAFGRASRRNAQGQEIVRKDLPMVSKTFSAEAPNWGDWGNGSHDVYWDRDVYQRDFTPPKELEISVALLAAEPGDDPVFVFRFRIEEVLDRNAGGFEAELLGNLNLLQENTGAADVFAADADSAAYLGTISVSWEILPPGELGEMLARVLSKFRDPNKQLREKLLDRLNFLETLKPIAYISGTSGFQRYFGAKLAENVVVFENLDYGNAIYVMFEDWEELSKRSRLDLLRNRGKVARFERVVHRKGWKDALLEIIGPRRKAA